MRWYWDRFAVYSYLNIERLLHPPTLSEIVINALRHLRSLASAFDNMASPQNKCIKTVTNIVELLRKVLRQNSHSVSTLIKNVPFPQCFRNQFEIHTPNSIFF